MNKSMLLGLVGGIAVATAGGVAGYAFLGQQDAVPTDEAGAAMESETASVATPAPAAPVPAPQPVARTAPAPAPVTEECWDEEVQVPVQPRDQRAIAGTAIGALVGGALAKEVGDDKDLVTAAGAAAGAYAGRRVQQNMQANNTTTVIERRCAPVGTR
jgi:uncharacterized protein YcfJ